MITYVDGDLFESSMQTLVNPVNCVGVMGKGLALGFKERYPRCFPPYEKACEKGLLKPGMLLLYKESYTRYILQFPTKMDWREPSELSYIEEGLKKFADNYLFKGIASAAFPPLGCGCGGLSWEDVKPLMEKYLRPLVIQCEIYVPHEGK